MYELKKRYGYKAFQEWEARKPRDLENYKSSTTEADRDVWVVPSYSRLLDGIAFLTAMNKRLTLFFRGQTCNIEPKPALFRSDWSFLGVERFPISQSNRKEYWKHVAGGWETSLRDLR